MTYYIICSDVYFEFIITIYKLRVKCHLGHVYVKTLPGYLDTGYRNDPVPAIEKGAGMEIMKILNLYSTFTVIWQKISG